ncbi:cell division protein ZipA [Alishewanella longhuensis]|uniref:Cell division protein ZipA n=1 Tax=Alishewanella longhuensis TaxID=1091037 RepID=A0ABQ3KVP7_9ALTE|nr:cell division protein ZipA [Alishewanella longhuensis]GHG63596.1 cell division protein ZipA [Alishewanella longhuensis]
MASELRLVLIILGALVLGGLFLHGLWTVRKNSSKTQHRYHPEDNERDNSSGEGFDELGIGPVRVVKGAGKKPVEPKPRFTTTPKPDAKPQSRPIDLKRRVEPTEQDDLFQEPQEPVLNFSALADEDLPPATTQDAPDYDEYDEPAAESPAEDAGDAEPSEVLILYVLLPEQQELKGQELLSALTVLGFKYGEMDIFHRHQDSAGNGEVLFSLANMFNPGTFDIDNMDKLSTRGLSLFMTLPGPGEPLQNFNVMHNAAKKLAEEFGGQVLDGQRSVLTVQTVRHYVERIREFQRQRLIRR